MCQELSVYWNSVRGLKKSSEEWR